MSASIFTAGLTTIKNSLKTAFSPYIGVSNDTTAFSASQTSLNPAGGSTVTYIAAATITDVSATQYTATITINGTTQFTGYVINTVGACTGTTTTTAQSRTVRPSGLGFGVTTGDTITVGLTISVSDQS